MNLVVQEVGREFRVYDLDETIVISLVVKDRPSADAVIDFLNANVENMEFDPDQAPPMPQLG